MLRYRVSIFVIVISIKVQAPPSSLIYINLKGGKELKRTEMLHSPIPIACAHAVNIAMLKVHKIAKQHIVRTIRSVCKYC